MFLLAAAAALSPSAWSQEIGQPIDLEPVQFELTPSAIVPEGLRDPGFDRFINLSQVSEALGAMDANLMCDLALQLRQGELVLGRAHSGLSSTTLFDVALRFAVQKKDKEAVKRLASIGDATNGLKTKVEAVKPLIESARATGPMVALDSLNPTEIETYQSYQIEIGKAAAIGDKEDLQALLAGLSEVEELSDATRKELGKNIQEAIASVPTLSESELQTLQMLSAVSRDTNKGEIQNSLRSGGWTVAFGNEINHLEYAKLVACIASGTVGACLADLARASASAIGMEVFIKAMKNRGQIFNAGKLKVQGNIATYNHWQIVNLGGIKKKIPYPNTHQPYVRWKRS